MKGKYWCFAVLFSLVFSSVLAQGVPIEPGMWEITSTMKIPMLPKPRVTTSMECIVESELSPEAMTEEDMDSNCTFDTRVVDGNTMLLTPGWWMATP